MRTIAHISDIHFGRIDLNIVEGLVADVSQRQPTLLVVSGDLTQRARRRQYTAAAALLARLPRPQLVVPGNHDVPLYDLIRRAFAPLQFYQRHITSDLRPLWRDDEMLVVGLNTTRALSPRLKGFWKDGGISAAQLDDLREVFCNTSEDLFKIVVTHHPFIPAPGQDPDDIVHGAAAALQCMQQCGVDLLLAGHLHVCYSGDVRTHHQAVQRSILSVQAGSATSTRCRGQPNSYNWIIIHPDHVTIETRSWDGRSFSASATTSFARIGGIWQQDQ
jgi:3',5'-cyclic AMP phosphodiesterase CpdA